MELAIQKDCEAMIEGFVSNENPSFESFVYQWKNILFQRIYKGQSISTEIIQSTNACVHYAKRILGSNSTMPRLGALYLLYAIHFKQPTDRYYKIDIDLKTWLHIKETLFGSDNQLYVEDAKCIFLYLLKENAFRFVASDIYYGLENLINLDKIRMDTFNLTKTMNTYRNDLKYLTCRKGLFAGITKLEDGYSEMKELMNQGSNTEKTNTALPISKSFQELKIAFNNLQSFLNKNRPHKEKNDKDLGSRREQIKRKSIVKAKNKDKRLQLVLRDI